MRAKDVKLGSYINEKLLKINDFDDFWKIFVPANYARFGQNCQFISCILPVKMRPSGWNFTEKQIPIKS